LRCTVLVDAGALPQWKHDCIEAMRAAYDVETLSREHNGARNSLVRRVLGGRMLHPVALASSSTASVNSDFILDLRSSAPNADVAAESAPYWYFCDGDGAPLGDLPGAAEIANGSPTFTLQLRTRRPDGSTETLRTGTFKLLYGYGRSLEIALNECCRWPAIARPSTLPQKRAAQASSLAGRFNGIALLWYVARAFFAHAYAHLLLDARWEVGLIAGSPEDFLRDDFVPDVRWVRETSGFFADPFVVTMSDRRYVLGERLDGKTRNGFIACLEIGENGQVLKDSTVLRSSTHLSYPYVFAHDGAWYMVPENAQAKRAILYRAIEAPYHWEPLATVVDGVGSCDNTIVRYADRWWLFCTHPSRDANLNLFLYHAQDLRGPWTAHAANPVKTDIRSARPAGTPFVVDGVLYRPAQNCVRSYGDAIAFNRITALDEETFSEEVVATFTRRNAGKPNQGVHTISHTNGTVAIDCKTVTRAGGRLVRQRLSQLVTRALSLAT
jgi:hypothetical protein